ncbi:MAG: UPF0262 family protein [Rhodospirillaceae bacterium]|nr:UPF0262 family protein [Rhodospirillaceae bacterium]MBT5245686.1 UPF0262 family protein [Rhodospirillaceae bacterium]MBT5561215.1 UPF0262 family protein [Rhodospirillaceae bacterium]MBT6240508.1 UPF0262 family protein [Rhodospirillaceae bacterium]
MADQQRIAEIFLDERSVVSRSAQVDHERKVAIYDLLEENRFKLTGDFPGPFHLHLSIAENRLIFDVRDTDDKELARFTQPLSPLRSVVKDYFMVCDSYFKAIKVSSPSQIEAIDMGRRGLHNEGADILKERLAEKVDIDTDTARRLFTLICVLHIRV